MKFKSYAQNFEDYILWRALRSVEKGFYVDVGAQHPVIDSVSRGFYDLGWRGIHIEPVAVYAEQLRQDRPDEKVFQLALGSTAGKLDLNVIADTGLSTGVRQLALAHAQHGFVFDTITVPLATLASVLTPYTSQEIHWLKIDVEGFEKQVLEGWDSQKHRPWIMVVESTEPMTRNENHTYWEYILTNAQYDFVYFDGLNRFYVAREHLVLKAAFTGPINVFDSLTVNEDASPQSWLGFKEQRDGMLADLDARLQSTINALQKELDQSEDKLILSESIKLKTDQRLVQEAEVVLQLQSALRSSEQRLVQEAEVVLQLQSALRSSEQRLVQEAEVVLKLQLALSSSEDALDFSQQEAEERKMQIADAERQLLEMRQSVSWRLTMPLRSVSSLLPDRLRFWLRRLVRGFRRYLTSWRVSATERLHNTVVDKNENETMKSKLKELVRNTSSWPISGRFIRIIVAVVRLPEERIQFRQHMAEHTTRMQNEENALAAANERLTRHEHFISVQMPRLAQKVAEVSRVHKN
jgi:FkbM family methyltransferase